LESVATYHTRPMSEDWSKPREIDPLADGQVVIDFAIPLAEFPRLRTQLARDQGSARGRIQFHRMANAPVADVSVSAEGMLICQRCMGPLQWSMSGGGSVAMVADAVEADRAPAGLETILAPGHRVSVRDLVEEELLLSLPIAPLHESDDASGCGVTDEKTPAEERNRPFAQLGKLLKRAE